MRSMKLGGRMKRYLAVMAMLALAGCASVAPRPASPVPRAGGHEKVASTPVTESSPNVASEPAASAVRETPSLPAGPAQPPATESVSPGRSERTEGEIRVIIESVPSGATVVVNGRPAGRTPFALTVTGTSRGFFREEQAIRVRFIATQASETSATVEEVFAPTDRIPERVIFTPKGARRIF